MSTGAPTVRSLDNRMDDIEKQFLVSQARMDVIVSLVKWIAGFSLASMLAVIIQLLSVSFYAGNLLEKVNTQATITGKMQEKIELQGNALQVQGNAIIKLQEKIEAQGLVIQEVRTEVREIKKDLTVQAAAIQDMKAELRDIRKDLTTIRDELKKLTEKKVSAEKKIAAVIQ